jgi:hypothetical protein
MKPANPIEKLFTLKSSHPASGSALTLGSVAVIAFLDYVTGRQYSFSLFYLIPIALCVFAIGPRWGYLASLLCTALWFANNLLGGRSYESAFELAWSLVMRLLSYAIFCYVLGKLRSMLSEQTRAAEDLKAAYDEKALLHSELQHRVKNSIASVASLLSLEASRSGDPRLVEVLERLENRVFSIAALYDLMFRSRDSESVLLPAYLGMIADDLA